MSKLIPIEHNNQRVMFTFQLAEFYKTDDDTISQNFRRNPRNFLLGEDYYVLQGAELKQFKDELKRTNPQIEGSFRRANILYIWTEYGALMHAKSLQNDRALEVFRELRASYFVVQQKQKQYDTINEAFRMRIEANKWLAEKMRFTVEEKTNVIALQGHISGLGFADNAFLDTSLGISFKPWCEQQGDDMSLVRLTKEKRLVGWELDRDGTYNFERTIHRKVYSYPEDPFGLAWTKFLVEFYWPEKFLPYITRKYKGEERVRNIESGIKVISFFTGLSEQQINAPKKRGWLR
jgi:ORF6N domain